MYVLEIVRDSVHSLNIDYNSLKIIQKGEIQEEETEFWKNSGRTGW